MAFISVRTGKSAKTHSGVRSEFAHLALQQARIGRDQVSFLGWSYELKNAADYEQGHTVTLSEAERGDRRGFATDRVRRNDHGPAGG